MKRVISIVVIVAIVGFVAYKSVYFENLTARNARLAAENFSPKQIVEKFWTEAMDSMLGTAVDIKTFDSLYKKNPSALVEKHGKTIGIGFPYSIFVSGECRVASVDGENIKLEPVQKPLYSIACGMIFSNSVREASGFFDIDAFQNTVDFNKVTAEINSRVMAEIVKPVIGKIEKGSIVQFAGAVDIYTGKTSDQIRIIPLKLTVKDE